MRPRSLVLAPLALLLLAATALAVTEPQLTATASSLDSSYSALKARFDADTESHVVLLGDYNVLEAQRAQLHHDRGTLPASCGCSTLDGLIASIDLKSADIQRVIDAWEEVS